MSPPQTIAHYRITAKLGEGGMGAVYRATDTKLNRDVAIKVLPPAFAEDIARMARFEREAQVLASLNHPNIASIYGIEQGAIVMELVEGADLAGPVPIDTAIAYARQIVAGLEAAHERGIVHRDLKPANIKVTPEGTVKLLDFGLAVAQASSPVSGDLTQSPTLSLAMTQAGMILGTAAYMSPEQARGKPVDRRADIWSFGVILWELLTGTMLFGGGETISDSLAAVITREPDFNALPKDTPSNVRRLIERCLRKDPKLRLRDIGEARILLDEPEVATPAQGAPPAGHSHTRWWMLAAAVSTLALAALSVVHFRETPPQPAAVRFQVPPPEGSSFALPFMTLSPDGRKLAFLATGKGGGPSLLWVRSLDSLEARALSGTEGATHHFWSPDSRFLAFHADGKLKKIEASGGPPQALCNVSTAAAVAGWWNPDGIIFFSNSQEGIFRVPQAGGEPVLVTKPDRAHGEGSYWYPQVLRDSRHYLYLILSAARDNNAIYFGSLDGKEKKRLAAASTSFRYVPPSENEKSGYLLFLREGTLMAQPLDPRTFELAGDAIPVAERVGVSRSYAIFSASPNGALAWRSGGGFAARQLTWFDRAGKRLATLGVPGDYNNVALSRDATRAAVMQIDQQTANRDIWLIDVARGIPTRFTFDEAEEWDPVWSPDASRVAFSSRRDGVLTLYVKDSSGAAKEERIQKAEASERPCDWSPDGRFLMYQRYAAGTMKLWFLSDPMDQASRRAAPYLETPYNTSDCQFSPGAPEVPRWVAYTSDESKHASEIFVQSFPAGAGKFQVSSGGGSQPRWRRDGKELFYIAPDGKVMAVDVKIGSRFEAGIPHALFDSQMFNPNVQAAFHYDVTPDGQRFLVNTNRQADSSAAPETITVELNWRAGLAHPR